MKQAGDIAESLYIYFKIPLATEQMFTLYFNEIRWITSSKESVDCNLSYLLREKLS